MKAVLKDVSRVHRVPVSVVNYITAIFGDANLSLIHIYLYEPVVGRAERVSDAPACSQEPVLPPRHRFIAGSLRFWSLYPEGNSRNDLAAHVYDITYGRLVPHVDNLVIRCV